MTSALSLTRLGFGVTGPHATPAVPRGQTIALVEAAVAAGVRVFDTGPMYGAGEAEARLGAALARLAAAGVAREALFITTKARTFPMPRDSDAVALSASERMRRSLHCSLRRLGVGCVDVLFLHGPRPEDFTPEVRDTLAAMRADGLAKAFGVCGRGPELDLAIERGGFEFLMMPVANQEARLTRAAARGIGVFAIETMRARAGRWRAPRSMADLWYLARAARDSLAGAAAPADTGIAGALALPAVASVIVQTTRAAHLIENAREAGI